MGQKVNPHGLRVGVIKDWDSKWYAEGDFADNLVEDYNIRTYLKKKLYSAGVSKIEIERASDRVKIIIYTAKPGVVIGKGGSEIEKVKKEVSNGRHRVIYHAHTTNVIALTFVLPLTDEVFTRELWEMATECPVVFPDGIGVVPWMVPGGRDIAVATSELMKKYDVAIWAHHGMFAAGEDFDLTFGLMHTVEKSAEILVKMLSMQPNKLQTITPQNFRDLARDFRVTLPEKFLYEK
mgnify:CR=1 FL=1